MFRRLYDAVVRLITQPSSPEPPMADLAREVRAPDPYVWRLPDPHDARWRRWSKRSRAVGHRLPFPCREECWEAAARPRSASWSTDDDVVRPYVLRP
ncbi:hypothetical protein [Streptomyces bobili]|uniref:hypothetical protein n=1 Tax=Streptomyces bobili TaxID=67280 RepID=UPI0034192EC0